MSDSVDAAPRGGWVQRHAAGFVLSVLLGIAGLAWAATSLVRPTPAAPAPAIETVEVWVAAKDLPVGTVLTRNSLAELVARKVLPKEGLPPACVVDEAELVDRRLTRPVLQGEALVTSALARHAILRLPDNMHLVSLPDPLKDTAIGPGSRVDVYATVRTPDATRTILIVADVLVLSVDNDLVYHRDGTVYSWASVGVTEDQAQMIALARRHNCPVQPRIRQPHDTTAPLSLEGLKKILAEQPQGPTFAEAPPPTPAAEKKWPGLVLPEGTVVTSLPVNPSHGAGFIGPGSKVDVVASTWHDNRFVAIPVLADVLVVAVETRGAPGGGAPEALTVSCAVTRDQSTLLALARERGCTLSPILLAPGKQLEREFDAKAAEALLRELPAPEPRPKP
jgi:Flp pilus assembly protein CpaB